jgi:hypothetical protein
MITHIKTAHEEQYSDGSKTLGVLLNFSSEVENDSWKESFVYIFKFSEAEGGRYIFFNTMVDLFDYMLYGEVKMKRAYMDEEEFDSYYDAEYIQGSFAEKLSWIG